jgi:hypothetical protein
MKKRIFISVSITILSLALLSLIGEIAIWIHWPLWGAGFFGEYTIEIMIFIAVWYAVIIGLISAVVYNVIQVFTNKNDDGKR